MATIAKLAVMLTANVGGFSAGMAKAAKPLASFAGGVMGTAAKIGGLVSAVTGLVGAGSIALLTKQSMEAIDANAKLSDRLGLTTESLVGLQYAGDLAGVSGEQLTGALEKMLKSLGGAADDGNFASNAFTKLGLSAKELAALPTDQAFASIADKISKIENPAERATAAVEIFGKSGQSLLPLMMSGAEGIAAAQKEAEKLGITYSRVDAAKVEAANDSMTRMKAVVEGVGNQLAIKFAPFIDAAATKLVELASSGDGMAGRVVSAFEAVVKGIASATDYLSLAKAGFKLLQAGATISIFGIVKAVDLIGSGLVKLLNLLPGVSLEWTTFTGQLADGLLEEAKQLHSEAGQAFASFQSGETSKAVGRFFDDIRAKSQSAAEAIAAAAPKAGAAFSDIEDKSKALQKVADTLADLEKQASQLGLSVTQKKIADLAALGAAPEQIARAKELLALQDEFTKLDKIDTGDPTTDFAAKMEQLQRLFAAQKISAEQFAAIRDSAKQTLNDKLTEQAKSITDSVKTPLEAYQEELDKLNVLLEQGLVTQEVFDRATAKAKQTLSSAQDATTSPKAIQAGSAEAQRFVFDQTRGMQRLNKDEVPKKTLAEAEEHTKLLEQVVRNTRTSSGEPEVVDV